MSMKRKNSEITSTVPFVRKYFIFEKIHFHHYKIVILQYRVRAQRCDERLLQLVREKKNEKNNNFFPNYCFSRMSCEWRPSLHVYSILCRELKKKNIQPSFVIDVLNLNQIARHLYQTVQVFFDKSIFDYLRYWRTYGTFYKK